jgi:hypothetical protein
MISHQGQDRGTASLVLLGTCILIALLLVFGLGGSRVLPGAAAPVTIGQGEQVSPFGTGNSLLIGSQGRREHVGRALGEGLKLAPRTARGEVIGYVIREGSAETALDAGRLQVGDMLTSIDDRPLDETRVRTLGQELSAFDRVEIRFERNDRPRKRTIQLVR